MQVISSKVPTLDGFNRRKNVDIKNLEQKIRTIRNMVGVDNPSITKPMRFTPNDMECLVRVFKTLDYTEFSKEKFASEVKASSYFSSIIGKWFMILNSMKYSDFIAFKQYQEPRYNIATSLPMLAAREKCDLPYKAWRNTIDCNFLFSKVFQKALVDAPTEEEYRKIKTSSELLSAAKPRGDLQTYNLRYVGTRFEGEDEEGTIELWDGFDSWPILIKHMKLQTWVFHPKFRSDSMVLDPYKWDEVPYSVHGDIVAPTQKKPSSSILDDLMI